MTLENLRKDAFSWTKAYIKGTSLDFCSYNFGISMRIHEYLKLYSLYCICLRIYFADNISVKICEGFVFYKLGNLVNIFVKCHQRKGPGGKEDVQPDKGQVSRGG